jgi:hypothetical protein
MTTETKQVDGRTLRSKRPDDATIERYREQIRTRQTNRTKLAALHGVAVATVFRWTGSVHEHRKRPAADSEAARIARDAAESDANRKRSEQRKAGTRRAEQEKRQRLQAEIDVLLRGGQQHRGAS